jgi:hypothetical protein
LVTTRPRGGNGPLSIFRTIKRANQKQTVMIRQKQIVNPQNGNIYFKVTFEVFTQQLMPHDLYEQIDELIYKTINEYEPKDEINK